MSIYNSPAINPSGTVNTLFNPNDFKNALGEPVYTNTTQTITGQKLFSSGAIFQNSLKITNTLTTDTLTMTGGITANYTSAPTYTSTQIGYSLKPTVSAVSLANTMTNTQLSSITLPCYGTYFVNWSVGLQNNGSGTTITLAAGGELVVQINNASASTKQGVLYNPSSFSVAYTGITTLNDSFVYQPANSADLTLTLNVHTGNISGGTFTVIASDTVVYTSNGLTYFHITRLS